jgi:glycosyltransferase involved in cell wall biosynthesis
VSIGLPVYNAGAMLAPNLAAVMAQTFEDFEFIICDNASTDGTSEQCRELAASDPRVRYYRNDENIGAAANHNRVAELATGEYFKWCGHDDLIEPTFIERCVDVLDKDEERRFVLCFSLLDSLDESGEPVGDPVQSPVFADPAPHERLRSFWAAPRMHQVIYSVIRRRELMSTGLIGEWYGSDRQTLVELALLGGFARVEDVLFHHREHPGRSQYVPDKRIWMLAGAAGNGARELGYWRRVGYLWEILNREYLTPKARFAVASEYTKYAAARAAHWIPQLGRELNAAAHGRRRLLKADRRTSVGQPVREIVAGQLGEQGDVVGQLLRDPLCDGRRQLLTSRSSHAQRHAQRNRSSRSRRVA